MSKYIISFKLLVTYLEYFLIAYGTKPTQTSQHNPQIHGECDPHYLPQLHSIMSLLFFLCFPSVSQFSPILSSLVNLHITFFLQKLTSLGLVTHLCAFMSQCPPLSQTLLLCATFSVFCTGLHITLGQWYCFSSLFCISRGWYSAWYIMYTHSHLMNK